MEIAHKRIEDGPGIRVSKRRRLDKRSESEQGSSQARTSTHLSHDDYTIGWVCLRPLELAAAKAMLDQVHRNLPNIGNDTNSYVLGQICDHNIAIACLPSGVFGTISTIKMVNMMVSSFSKIGFALMVGIGGGVPSPRADIRLGDVVVSAPNRYFGGVVRCNSSTSYPEGTFHCTLVDALMKPPPRILAALSSLCASHMLDGSRIPEFLSEMVAKYSISPSQFIHPGQQHDQLFEAQYEHIIGETTCALCDPAQLVARPPRARSDPKIHYGLIASGAHEVKRVKFREELSSVPGVLCYDEWAAGFTANLPCLVIRGISDYTDSHMNERWHGYAAATAAAYAKDLLSVIPQTQKFQAPTANRIPSRQPSGTEFPSLTGDHNVQTAILRYNTGLLIQRLQAAHSALSPHQQDALPQPTDNRSISVSTNNNNLFLQALLTQLTGSIKHQQEIPVPLNTSHSQGIFSSSLTIGLDPNCPKHRGAFRIALLCALPLEANAVKSIFDKRWDDDGDVFGKAPMDQNAYSTGTIGRHNVVLAHMPAIGKEAAASVAANIRSSFQGIQLAIVVGICGGVPTTPTGDEIFLGDVVISEGIVPHDFGRQYPDHFARKDSMLDILGRPNAEIRSVLAKLKSRWDHKNLETKINRYITNLQQDLGEISRYPGASQDKLFLSSYRHKHQRLSGCNLCETCSDKTDPVCHEAIASTCEQLNCDDEESVLRTRIGKSGAKSEAEELSSYEPKVHFGLVASGNIVMKSGEDRDQIAKREKVIAFETEGAGVWDTLPCLIIKGVCDYADSHKSKIWQDYAAVSAAACMKAFLENWITNDNPIFM